jgi:hypothetical protein
VIFIYIYIYIYIYSYGNVGSKMAISQFRVVFCFVFIKGLKGTPKKEQK